MRSAISAMRCNGLLDRQDIPSIQISRRGLITGLTSLLAAPAIVRASSLMTIAVQPVEFLGLQQAITATEVLAWRREFFA